MSVPEQSRTRHRRSGAQPGLLAAAEVMDALRSPGGCPWDADQTHASLRRHLLEEAYEVLEALDAREDAPGPAADARLADELGDLLLQVLFHARVARDRDAFDIDAVARGLVDKLVRRHPHVFERPPEGPGESTDEHPDAAAGPPEPPLDAGGVHRRWEELKAAEHPERGPLDGIPRDLPALARADKLLARLARHDLALPSTTDDADGGPPEPEHTYARELLHLVGRARDAGVDPESALRAELRRVEAVLSSDISDRD